jgi:hypothetical protein
MSHGPRTIDLDRQTIPPGSGWSRLPVIGGVIGAVGLVASLVMMQSDPAQFYWSWLVGFMYFLSISLGGLFFVLINYATKAGWGIVVRRLAENVMSVLPLFAILAIPVILGIEHLFHWSDPEVVAHDHLLQGKAAFLNTGFFTARAIFYLACWTGLSWFFGSRSRRQDKTGDPKLTHGMIFFAGPSIAIFALTLTFASFDWIMSLDAHWYSTIFGVYYFSGALVGIFALTILLATGLNRAGHLSGVVNQEHLHDLGKLLFAFTVFWAYIGFSQFFLIWYGNIPEETVWYMHRAHHGWDKITLFLALGHFAAPFLFLMPRTIKRSGLLAVGCVWMLIMHWVDMYWLIMPNHHPHLHFSPLDFTTSLAIGGFFMAAIGWFMNRHALVPINDPRLVESLTFENQ